MKRIKHNDLTHYFLRDREELPKAYLKKVDKFMWEIRNNLITKQDAAILYKIKQDKYKDLINIRKHTLELLNWINNIKN